jgi:hypothetical protein
MWAQIRFEGAAYPALEADIALQAVQEPAGDLIAPEKAADVEA